MRYVTRSILVDAVQWWKDGDHPKIRRSWVRLGWGVLDTSHGPRWVSPGMWIATRLDDGEIFLIADDLFRAAYIESDASPNE